MSGIPNFLNFIKPQDFVAEVKSIDWLNEVVCSIWFNVVEGSFEFEAGQFVNLKFIDPNGEEVQRAYSVASAPAGKSGLRFELCVEIIEDGKAGKYFSEMKVGDECKFKGPFGFCTLPPESQEAVLVGTGTGIAPIKAILEDLKNKRMDTKVSVLFGFRYWENRFYLEELDRLSSKIEGDFWICMSRQNMAEVVGLEKYENLKFTEGRVTSLLDKEEILNNESDLYICGGSNMIKEVREMGLHAEVDKSRIHVEIFD